MASNQEVTIPLRYWVDNEQNRVVMAEASGDFVDVLFSFLTLPLGAIMRLESEGKFSQNQSHQPHQPVEIGCIMNLYKSVEDLSHDVFWNDICKQMLVSPRNPLEASCRRLKLNVDNTWPTEYFMCSKCSDLLLSTFVGANCHCGKPMNKKVELQEEESKKEPAEENGVFVKGDAVFLIFDDLRVLRSSPSDSVQPPFWLGHKDFNKMEEIFRDVGTKEIFSILKQALTSKSPLSDVFLENRESNPTYSFSPDTGPCHWKGSVEIKVMVSKSKNKILFAEADGDFVDFLVSFLTTPLGSILNLINGKLFLGSIDNLYTSVKNLNPSWFIVSSNQSLLNPRVAPQFGCKSNPLNALKEIDTPKYWYGTVVVKDKEQKRISKKKDIVRGAEEMKLFDPRSSGAREPAVGFMKRPCLFVVRDDLQVIPMTTTSSILYLQELDNVKLDDLEEHLVEIRSHEALNLLRASLTSNKAAFTQSLFCQLKKWKCQRYIPCWGVLGWEKKRHRKKKEKEDKKVREIPSDMMKKRERDKEKVKKKEDGRKNMSMSTTPEENKGRN